jgi:hypothetical protein
MAIRLTRGRLIPILDYHQSIPLIDRQDHYLKVNPMAITITITT